MSPEANAFEWAEFLIESGVPCEDLMEEWMLGVTEMGLRYCPLAEELILAECPEEEREPSEEGEVGREAVAECEALANVLAELDQRGEIVLSEEALELVKGVLAGEDVEGLANGLAELDQRGEISLSEEELSLVRCVLGVEEVVEAVEVEVEVVHVGAVFAEFHCDGPDGSVDRDCVGVFTVVGSFEQARADAVLWAYRSPRHVLIYSDESRAVLLADVRGY